jgi:hypothetical protein
MFCPRVVDSDTDHYVVAAEVRERLLLGKQCSNSIWRGLTIRILKFQPNTVWVRISHGLTKNV